MTGFKDRFNCPVPSNSNTFLLGFVPYVFNKKCSNSIATLEWKKEMLSKPHYRKLCKRIFYIYVWYKVEICLFVYPWPLDRLILAFREIYLSWYFDTIFCVTACGILSLSSFCFLTWKSPEDDFKRWAETGHSQQKRARNVNRRYLLFCLARSICYENEKPCIVWFVWSAVLIFPPISPGLMREPSR